MITYVVRLGVLPGNHAALERLLGEVRDMTLRHESGVLWYGFARSVDQPDSYVVVEVYRDAEVHAAHMATAWVKNATPDAVRLTGGAIDIARYESTDAASPAA
jgi:quinol monooxygenase YgiN